MLEISILAEFFDNNLLVFKNYVKNILNLLVNTKVLCYNNFES